MFKNKDRKLSRKLLTKGFKTYSSVTQLVANGPAIKGGCVAE